MSFFFKVYGFILITLNAHHAFGSEQTTPLFFEKNFHPLEIIVSYSSPKDFTSLYQTSKTNKSTFSNTENSIGSLHRKNSKFSVTDKNGKVYYIEEYLSKSGSINISKVDKIHLIAKERPKDFIKIVLKSIPYAQENIDHHLKEYYVTMQMNKIAHYLPHYATYKDKLTALLVEFGIYNQVVLFSFYETLKEQLEGTPLSEDGEQIVNQINLHQGRVISEQFLSHIRDQFSIYSSVDFLELNSKIFVLIFDFLREQIPTKEFKDHMSNFDLVSAYNKGKINEILKPVIENIITYFQLSSLTMKHSDAYNNLLKNKENSFIKIINENITEEQARNILANIQVPEVPKDQFLIKNQIEILCRHLPQQN